MTKALPSRCQGESSPPHSRLGTRQTGSWSFWRCVQLSSQAPWQVISYSTPWTLYLRPCPEVLFRCHLFLPRPPYGKRRGNLKKLPLGLDPSLSTRSLSPFTLSHNARAPSIVSWHLYLCQATWLSSRVLSLWEMEQGLRNFLYVLEICFSHHSW